MNMNTPITRFVLLMLMTVAFCGSAFSQQANYKIVTTESSSSSNVKVKLLVYGKSKKTIDAEAQCAALRIVLFDGCPNTTFSKALMEDGEVTSVQKFPQYFESLYGGRYSDFIASYEATSSFKKGDNKKGTEYIVEVKVLGLRKDLEKNGLKRKIGL